MSLQEEIKEAIGAHGLWKARLVSAIDTGRSDFTPEKVCADNQCDFGKWLYGATIPATERAGSHYAAVRKLHADFHQITGDVLKVALAGKKDEAHKMIDPKSHYIDLSGDLTRAMMKWAASAK